jgi:TatD DNase family protein
VNESAAGRGAGRGAFARDGDPPPAPDPLPRPALDSHCHFDLMDVPVADAVAQARAVGIERMVTVGVDVETSRWQVETAEQYDEVYAAVAVHPNEAPSANEADWAEIEKLAAHPKVVAIGETGLDHYRTGEEGRPRQEESFRRHIDIAKRTGKALMIHDRDAHDDVFRVLDSEGAPDRVVFHCFSGDAAFARRCADRGYVMSFAGNVTFKNADELRAAAAVAPADLILVETDAPFLTPMPYRGRPNAPYLVPLTVAALAGVRREDVGAVAEAITATAARVFAWS